MLFGRWNQLDAKPEPDWARRDSKREKSRVSWRLDYWGADNEIQIGQAVFEVPGRHPGGKGQWAGWREGKGNRISILLLWGKWDTIKSPRCLPYFGKPTPLDLINFNLTLKYLKYILHLKRWRFHRNLWV